MSDFSQAEAQFRRSIELTKELRDSDPSNIVYVRRYQLSLTTLGNMLTEAGHPDQGLPILQQSLAVARDIAAAEPASLIHQATLATTLSQVTAALCNLDRKTDALPFAREEVDVFFKRLDDARQLVIRLEPFIVPPDDVAHKIDGFENASG